MCYEWQRMSNKTRVTVAIRHGFMVVMLDIRIYNPIGQLLLKYTHTLKYTHIIHQVVWVSSTRSFGFRSAERPRGNDRRDAGNWPAVPWSPDQGLRNRFACEVMPAVPALPGH